MTLPTLLAAALLFQGAPAPAKLDSIIRRAVADKHLIGVSVGVMHEGKVILAKGYGTRTWPRATPSRRRRCSASAPSPSSSPARR